MKYLLLALIWLVPLVFFLGLFLPFRKSVGRTRKLEAAKGMNDPASLIGAVDDAVATYRVPGSSFRSEREFDTPPTGNPEEFRDFFHYHVLATLEERVELQRKRRPFFFILIICLSFVFLLPLFSHLSFRVIIVLLLGFLPGMLILVETFIFIALHNRQSLRQLELVREIDAKLRMET